jgi:hypothetical protein
MSLVPNVKAGQPSVAAPERSAGAATGGRAEPLVGRYHPPISGTARVWQIFFASRFGISECLGTASTTPVFGLHHKEWAAPSRLR